MNFVHERHYRALGGEGVGVLCHKYLVDKGVLFCGLSDGKIAWWKRHGVVGGRPQPEDKPFYLEGHVGAVRCVEVVRASGLGKEGILIISGSSDRTIRVWDPWVRDAKTLCVQTIRGHEGTITGLAVHGRLLLSCSTDQTLRVWQMDEGRELLLYPWYSLQETLHDHDCWINAISLALTGESGELFVADERGAISVYQLTIRGRQTSLTRWQQHPAVHALGISQMLLVGHENLLITIAFDQTMRALNLSTGQPIVTVANPNRARYCGAHWHSPSRQLFLVDEHGFAFVWSIHAERCVKEERLLGPGALAASPASFVSVSAAGDEMLACEASGCHVWRCVRNLGYKEVAGHAGPVIALHVAEGAGGGTEGLLYSASLDNTIKAWDPYDMSCVSTLREGYSEMSCLLVSSTNGFLISGNDDGSIRLWNPDSGSTINLLEHTNTVTCLDACVRGRSELLLSAGFDGHVAVWDITKRKHSMPQIETVFAAHAPHEILALRANPHNETILTAGNDAVIKVWSWHTYALLATLSGHADAVTALCLDGNFLLSGSDDCTVKVWDTHTNTLLSTIRAHDEAVQQLLVVPESGFLVTLSSESVRVWQYSEGRMIREWRHPSNGLRSLCLLRKSRRIVCGTDQANIVIFSLDEANEAEAARARALGAGDEAPAAESAPGTAADGEPSLDLSAAEQLSADELAEANLSFRQADEDAAALKRRIREQT